MEDRVALVVGEVEVDVREVRTKRVHESRERHALAHGVDVRDPEQVHLRRKVSGRGGSGMAG